MPFYHLILVSLELGIFIQTWYLTNRSEVTLSIAYVIGTESYYVKLVGSGSVCKLTFLLPQGLQSFLKMRSLSWELAL